MANFELAYGRGFVSLEVPDRNLAAVLEPRAMPTVELRQAFRAAWDSPHGMIDPASTLRRGASLVFVVTDHTRRTPTRDVFPLVWERLVDVVEPQDVTLLVGTGTHRASTDEELERMLGDVRRQFRVVQHDCDGDVVEVGRSRRGTPILVNRLVAEADHVVTLGHVGMHYYAGYSGGRKNILPGVAARATIEANHAQLSDPQSRACVYQGNPVSDEMVEAAQMVRMAFLVDVVLDASGAVAKVVVGEPEAAHAEARRFWDAHAKVRLEGRADVVIASAGGHPKDIDLYQAHKAEYMAACATRDGGIVALAASCPDGIGNKVFRDWIERSERPEDVERLLASEGFKLGGHKAVYLARDARRIDVCLRSELDPRTVRRFFVHPVEDLAEVLKMARRRFGEDYRAVVMPHAGDVFPVCSEAAACGSGHGEGEVG
ncbi:MAG: nickel-dependent lactate racemase [Candidatus Bipolaricaulota bacterium]